MKTDVRKFLKKLKREGWEHTVAGSGHIRITHPSGRYITMSASPSCPFWQRHVEGDIRRLQRELKNG